MENSHQFPNQGFYATESEGTWSMGARSRVILPGFTAPPEGCWLEIDGVGLFSPRLPESELSVEVNGTPLARFEVAETC